jgi:signal transduction histidine kinase
MVATGRASTANPGPPSSGSSGDQGGPRRPGPAAAAARVVRAVAGAPFTARSRRELAFCVAGIPFVLPVPLAAGWAAAALLWWLTPGSPPNLTWLNLVGGGLVMVAVAALLVATGASRTIGGLWRALAARLLRAQVAAPPPVSRQGTAAGRLAAGLRDGPGWRAIAYLLVKLPAALLGCYAVFFWVGGLVNLSFPLWWLSFRNHGPGVHLNPVAVRTPFDWWGQGHFTVATFPGTFAAAATGAAMLLAAPWVTRAVVSADRWLITGLLGPGRLAQRVQDLEQSRALAVDDSAARLRHLERDLHDGAQIRLATLAMNLGMAKEKLGGDGQVPDPDAVRELVDTALRDTKETIGELRHLARGIHPPALDHGLSEALQTLAASSAVAAGLEVSIPVRPTQAIETIAYFCAAELLANAVKHSGSSKIIIRVAGDADTLRLSVSDNGSGGASPQPGSGLAGLRQRVAVVDGSLAITSPPGGPTQVTVTLPLRA